MQFTQLTQKHREVEQEIADFLTGDNPFIEDLRLKEAQYSVMELSRILNENNIPQLTAFLAQRWQRIAGSRFDYLSTPDAGITQLCLLIAQWLHHKDSSKKIYQYLMPTLTRIEDTWGMFSDKDNIDGNIDKFPLSCFILSDDKTALIPIALLTHLYIDAEVEHNLWFHPYNIPGVKDHKALSEHEKQALFAHSTIAAAIQTQAELIRQYTLKSPTLGGEIQRLAKGLFEGSVLRKGTEYIAAAEASEAINTFMKYWKRLDGAVREEFYFVQADKGTPYLGDLIHLLSTHEHIQRDDQRNIIKREQLTTNENSNPQAISDLLCAKLNADKLNAILEKNKVLYTQSPESVGLLEEAISTFELLKEQLPQVKGYQKNPLTLQSIHCIEDELAPYLKQDDLITLFSELGIEVSLVLCQMTGFLTKEKLMKQNSGGETVLHWAVKNNHIEIVRAIVAANADTDFLNSQTEMEYTALMIAAKLGHTDCLKAILDKNACDAVLKVKGELGCTAMMFAAVLGHADCVKAILDKNASDGLLKMKNNSGTNALMFAADNGHTGCVKAILDKSASDGLLKIQDFRGMTALMSATKNGHIGCVKAILDKNASDGLLKMRDNGGMTALMMAARKNRIDCVKAILDKNASNDLLELQNHDGMTALMIAVDDNRADCIKAILDKNASTDLLKIQNKDGETALILALLTYHPAPDPDCIKAILAKNAYSKTILIKDCNGKTAVNYSLYHYEIRTELDFILYNPFLQMLQHVTTEKPPLFWRGNPAAQLHEFIALYRALYHTYEKVPLKQTLADFNKTYCPDDKTDDNYLKIRDDLFKLDEETLALQFKRFIDEVKYTSQEPDLSGKTKNVIAHLIEAQNTPNLEQIPSQPADSLARHKP